MEANAAWRKRNILSLTDITFSELGLAVPILRALRTEEYTTPTPIQEQAIPLLLEGGDLLGVAQTGTGKTAAFALPILHRLAESGKRAGPRQPQALVLAPTRELAIQIGEGFRAYGRNLSLRYATIYGGVGQVPQVKALRRGVDVLIATPGRLLDLMGQGHLALDKTATLVLDEADRMLDMGFIHDVRRIVAALPARRQSLLFSATMPKEISRLADEILNRPKRVEVAPSATPVELIDQRVYFVETSRKRALLDELLRGSDMTRVIIFTRTKHRANRVATQIGKSGIKAEAIHGNKSQNARQRALEAFRKGNVAVLVATDIAARGIDVDDVSHVVNYELPNEPESYVHRIGRTARAGATGVAISFCDAAEHEHLRGIEKLIKKSLTVVRHSHETDGAPVTKIRSAETKGKKRYSTRPSAKRRRNKSRQPQRAA
jgi:ATP-dependent RNA helicase RhlE